MRAGIGKGRQSRRLAVDFAGIGRRHRQRRRRDVGGGRSAAVDRVVTGVRPGQAQAGTQYRLVVADIRVKKGGRAAGIADGCRIGRQHAAQAAAGDVGALVAVIDLAGRADRTEDGQRGNVGRAAAAAVAEQREARHIGAAQVIAAVGDSLAGAHILVAEGGDAGYQGDVAAGARVADETQGGAIGGVIDLVFGTGEDPGARVERADHLGAVGGDLGGRVGIAVRIEQDHRVGAADLADAGEHHRATGHAGAGAVIVGTQGYLAAIGADRAVDSDGIVGDHAQRAAAIRAERAIDIDIVGRAHGGGTAAVGRQGAIDDDVAPGVQAHLRTAAAGRDGRRRIEHHIVECDQPEAGTGGAGGNRRVDQHIVAGVQFQRLRRGPGQRAADRDVIGGGNHAVAAGQAQRHLRRRFIAAGQRDRVVDRIEQPGAGLAFRRQRVDVRVGAAHHGLARGFNQAAIAGQRATLRRQRAVERGRAIGPDDDLAAIALAERIGPHHRSVVDAGGQGVGFGALALVIAADQHRAAAGVAGSVDRRRAGQRNVLAQHGDLATALPCAAARCVERAGLRDAAAGRVAQQADHAVVVFQRAGAYHAAIVDGAAQQAAGALGAEHDLAAVGLDQAAVLRQRAKDAAIDRNIEQLSAQHIERDGAAGGQRHHAVVGDDAALVIDLAAD